MQRQVRAEVDGENPERDAALPTSRKLNRFRRRFSRQLGREGPRRRRRVAHEHDLVDVPDDADGAVRAPAQPGGEEHGDQRDAVVELRRGARHVQLVEEPVEVQERGGQLVEDEDGAVVVEDGAEAQAEDEQGADGVGEEAQPEDVEVGGAEDEVPEEVSGREGLDEAAGAGVAKDALRGAEVGALFIVPDYP